MRFARIGVLAAASIVAASSVPGCSESPHRDRIAPEPHTLHHVGDNSGIYAPLYNDNAVPLAIKHFGLKGDRGLPIATIEGGDSDTLVVGASPKFWRFIYSLPMGLVFSNFFPSWLPTELYGTDWWYTEDWRAYLWASSYDSNGNARLEVTNGVVFLECVSSAAINDHMTMTCPDDPEVSVTVSNNEIDVDYPNGERRKFNNEYTINGTSTGEGIYALMELDKLTGTGSAAAYVPSLLYVRSLFLPGGNQISIADPLWRLQRIVKYVPPASPSPSATKDMPMIAALTWKDTNAPTDDCEPGTDLDDQCSSLGDGFSCYDRKCTATRSSLVASNCYSLLCGEYDNAGLIAIIPNNINTIVQKCIGLVCNGVQSCWENATPCAQTPPNLTAGDWKLDQLITPMAAARGATGTPTPLIYSFLYDGTSGSKYLYEIEDNRGPGANPTDPPAQPLVNAGMYFHGNTIGLSYDQLNYSRALKSVAFERGFDIHTRRIEESYGLLLQRIWTDRKNPYHFQYDVYGNSQPGPMTDSVTVTDTRGQPTTINFAPIGSRLPSASNLCDTTTGCNIQVGITSKTPPTGGTISYSYFGGSDGRTGELASETALDGTVTSYTLDPTTGIRQSIQSDCVNRTFTYGNPDFVAHWTEEKDYVSGKLVEDHTRTLCSATAGNCPASDYGEPTTDAITFGNPASRTIQSLVSYAGGNKTVTTKDGNLSRTLAMLGSLNPVSTEPGTVQVPGQTVQKSDTPDVTGDPTASSLPTCDERSQDCSGTGVDTAATKTQVTPYWPTSLDTATTTALAAINLAAPSGATTESISEAQMPQTNSTDQTTESGPFGTKTTGYTFDPGTGNVTAKTVTVNGNQVQEVFNWLNQDTSDGYKLHPDALASRVRYVNGNYAGGEYYTYSNTISTNDPYDTWRGPGAHGVLTTASSTSQAPADRTITQDPRSNQNFVVGCTQYSSQAANPGDCVQNFPTTFVCRQTFYEDADLASWRSDYTQINTPEWMNSQCLTPQCIPSTTICDNPQP
jgi:hypothetical protein